VSAGRLRLTVVTPERALLDGVACDEVTFPSERGELGILPLHTPLIALLSIGVVTYRDGARRESLAVRGGFAEIANDVVRLLADEATTAERVDRAALLREKETAEARRAAVSGEAELDAVNADVAFAEARLKLGAG
jgi:F-type H+-transporting ATPase subunit epsilon